MPSTTNSTDKAVDSGFRLTGRHVLTILVCTFGFVFAVNGYMLYRSVESFPGTVTESSYRDSQHFNSQITAAQTQAALGWQVSALASRSPEGVATIRIEAKDAAGAPLSGLTFHATLQHPANRAMDHVVPLHAVAGATGVFEGQAKDVAPGKWGVHIEGDNDKGRVFLSQNSTLLR